MEREGEVGGVVGGDNRGWLGPDIDRGLEFGTASELELDESSIIKVVLVVDWRFAGHEVERRAKLGVMAVGLLDGAIRRMGLTVASVAGIWRGETGASNSNLGVRLFSRTNASCIASAMGSEGLSGISGNGFWGVFVSGK